MTRRASKSFSAGGGDERPLSVGLRAARANLMPGLVIQACVVALVLAYYFWEPARGWLSRLAEFKRGGGYLFSAASGVLAGGLLPEVLTVAAFQRWRAGRENLNNLFFGSCFWGLMAVVVDGFYRAQALLFGTGVDIATVLKKAAVDQFLFTPFLTIPLTVAVFEWRRDRYRFGGLRRSLGRDFYRRKVLPAAVSGLGFWLPVVLLVYCLPPLLQFPLFTLALTLWVIIFTWISHAHKEAPG